MQQLARDVGEEAMVERRRRVLTRLAGFGALTEDEIAHLAGSPGTIRQLKRGQSIRADDDPPTLLHLLIDGWAASAISLPNGSRQLTAVSLPGDVLGLPALAVAEPLDAVVALSPVIVRTLPITHISRMFTAQPRLAAMLFLVSQEERVLAMERLALMGQAPALQRLAALFVRLSERVAQLEQETLDRFFMPLTQRDMADLIGVSSVHVNALVKECRTSGVLIIKDSEIQILDRQSLLDIAGVTAWRRSLPAWLPQP